MGERGRWLLDIDYPSLDRVEVYRFTEGRLLQFARVGDDLPFRLRPLQVRTHAVALDLQPGLRHELWLRVQTTSSMVLPISLMTAERYHQREATVQLLQGIFVGIGLCLLIYSIAQWLSLRDATFALYAVAVSGMTVFFFAYYGLGPQHVWGNSPWLTANVAPLSVLVALVGGLLFLDRTLFVAQHHPRLSLAMRGAALAAGTAAVAFASGLIDYRTAQLVSTVLGPSPIVLGLPAAVVRMRSGDRAALYVVIGWSLYGVGIVVMAALLRGYVGEQLVDSACVRTGHVDRDGDVAARARGAPGAAAPRGRAGRPRARGAALAGPHRPADRLAEPARPAGGARQRAAARRQRPHARRVPARSRRLQGHQRPPGPRCRRRVAEAGGAAAARTAASSRRGGPARRRRVRRDGHRPAGRRRGAPPGPQAARCGCGAVHGARASCARWG